jgi:hypothetical protein
MNKSEQFNRFSKWVAFGGQVLEENDRDEQRKLIKYNHLITNCLIFHNLCGMTQRLYEMKQESFGVPLPESIQFERCEAVADAALPVFLYLLRLAADGEVIYSDDTRVRILSCLKENKELKEEERRCTQTRGLVIEVGGRKIALYANGRRHAGENLDELLKARGAELGRPIQMSDALAANWSGQEETVEAKCLAHARRKFIDIERAFPVECGRVLDAIAEVYRVEAETEGVSAQERLERHQVRSGPVMAELCEWIEGEFAERRTEPNSSLGQAFRYVWKHWEGLTRFSKGAALLERRRSPEKSGILPDLPIAERGLRGRYELQTISYYQEATLYGSLRCGSRPASG